MQDMHDRQGSPPEPRTLLTADQVQRMLDLDRSTVYRMAADGRLPAVKVGRQWRFPADRIRDLLSPEAAPPDERRPAPVLPRPVAQPVIDVAASTLGVMMVVTDMAGHPLTEVANPNPWLEARLDDPTVLDACAAEWRVLADDLEFEPCFRLGHLGFECARALIRSGDRLIGMVLAGGIASDGGSPHDGGSSDRPDLFHLDQDQRRQVLSTLPKIATVLSRAAAEAAATGDRAPAGPPPQSRSVR